MSSRRKAFTLVELLVVITIIGMLIALLLPAVQGARESARKTQCLNHLKQLSLGAQGHHAAHGFLPSGGWGFRWVGEPGRGAGKNQPGGWLYHLLPYIEQQNLHEMGRELTGTARADAITRVVETPLSVMNCPTRRRTKLYPHSPITKQTNKPRNANVSDLVAMGDYAANAGGKWNGTHAGPGDFSKASGYAWKDCSKVNGIICIRSEISMAHIEDGASTTLLFGEKYINSDNYQVPGGVGNRQSMYIGFDQDVVRSTGVNAKNDLPPKQDTPGDTNDIRFGSAHSSSLSIAMCDGSCRRISYSIGADIWRRIGNRRDGNPVDEAKM